MYLTSLDETDGSSAVTISHSTTPKLHSKQATSALVKEGG